jgi:hypothetical protein
LLIESLPDPAKKPLSLGVLLLLLLCRKGLRKEVEQGTMEPADIERLALLARGRRTMVVDDDDDDSSVF